jgi:hypothetical protein
MIERFLYRLAAHHRIWNVEEWKYEINLRQLLLWIAAYKVEPFGEDWLRTARSTVTILRGLGCKVDEDFEQKFLPGYDPNREMTPDEIEAELQKLSMFKGRR